MVGASDPVRVRALLRANDNIVLLDPATNNLDVLDRAEAVVTVNSKSGAEALMLNRPVIVLGDAFYRGGPQVKAVDALRELPELLRDPAGLPRATPEEARSFFQAVWERSYPGELYSEAGNNPATFAASLSAQLASNRPA